MGKWLVLWLVVMGSQVQAKSAWFTLSGNPQDPTVDTVEVDPVAVNAAGDHKKMNVRVSRSGQRFNWEGVPYRSYESQVVFNCRAGKAQYLARPSIWSPCDRARRTGRPTMPATRGPCSFATSSPIRPSASFAPPAARTPGSTGFGRPDQADALSWDTYRFSMYIRFQVGLMIS